VENVIFSALTAFLVIIGAIDVLIWCFNRLRKHEYVVIDVTGNSETFADYKKAVAYLESATHQFYLCATHGPQKGTVKFRSGALIELMKMPIHVRQVIAEAIAIEKKKRAEAEAAEPSSATKE
jgi:hypothetical protein